MVTVRKFDVVSVGAVMGTLYALIGLIFGGIMTLLALAGAGAAGGGGPEAMLFGVGAIIIVPLFYGIGGFIAGLIMAAFYNVVSGMVGGIKVELYERPARR
jgi:hypothetical protein